MSETKVRNNDREMNASDAGMRRLDEIEARLKASSGGRWELSSSGTGVTSPRLPDDWLIACQLRRGDADLIAHAPADLALLADIARMGASEICRWGFWNGEAACVSRPKTDPAFLKANGGEPCLSCRIRRELAKEAVG